MSSSPAVARRSWTRRSKGSATGRSAFAGTCRTWRTWTGSSPRPAENGRVDVLFANAGGRRVRAAGPDHRGAFRQGVRHQRHAVCLFTVQKALPLIADGGVDHPERVDRVDQGDGGLQRLQRDQGGRAVVRPQLDLDLKDRKIRVNAISPGPIETPGVRCAWPVAGDRSEQIKAGLAAGVPLGRMGTPTRSPRRPCSWPPTTAASSPGSSCSSMAGWRRSENHELLCPCDPSSAL